MSKDARVQETLGFIRDHSKAVQVLHLNKSFELNYSYKYQQQMNNLKMHLIQLLKHL